MSRRFTALVATAEDLPELNDYVVLVAEAIDGSGSRLEFHRFHSFDEQDRALGQDTYCLATETGATYYGGVQSWSIADGKLTLVLDRSASDILDADGGYVIDLDRDHERTLAPALRRVIGAQDQS